MSADFTPSFEAKLEKLVRRHVELRDALSSGAAVDFAKLSKEYSDLSPVVESIEGLGRARAELAEAEALAAGDDAEMRQLAEEELKGLKERLPALLQRV